MNMGKFGEYCKEGVLYLLQDKVPVFGDAFTIHERVIESRWKKAISGDVEVLKVGFKRMKLDFEEVYKMVKDLINSDLKPGRVSLMQCAFPKTEWKLLRDNPSHFGASALSSSEVPDRNCVQVFLPKTGSPPTIPPEVRLSLPKGTASSLLDKREWNLMGNVLQLREMRIFCFCDPIYSAESAQIDDRDQLFGGWRFTLLHCTHVGGSVIVRVRVENVDTRYKERTEGKRICVSGESHLGTNGSTISAQQVQIGDVVQTRPIQSFG